MITTYRHKKLVAGFVLKCKEHYSDACTFWLALHAIKDTLPWKVRDDINQAYTIHEQDFDALFVLAFRYENDDELSKLEVSQLENLAWKILPKLIRRL